MIGEGCFVRDDLFGIAGRLREIDPDYFLFYRYETGKYEVHCRRQRGSSLAVTLPFDRLDCRAIGYVQKTRVENLRALIEETERHNERLKRDRIRSAVKSAEYDAERALSKGGKYD